MRANPPEALPLSLPRHGRRGEWTWLPAGQSDRRTPEQVGTMLLPLWSATAISRMRCG